MFKNLDDWFFHIKQIHQKRIDLGLDRVGRVADRLSVRTFSCPVITVAGTNGKGSCVKTLESIYAQAGYKTGLYTSPHLMQFNERIRIHNQNISDENLLFAFEKIEQARLGVILSFFEFTTLAALWLFQQAQCDVLILEVGLGGRLDAVNIVESDIAIVTSIALDHMEWLGNTRDDIAYEKASIARENKPVICGDLNPPKKLFQTVREKNAVLHLINREYFCSETQDRSQAFFACWSRDFCYDSLPIPHLKANNVATAIYAVSLLQNLLPVSENDLAQGICHTVLPGRFEIISSPPPCIFDVAHNPSASEWLADQICRLTLVKKTIAVVGMLKDKAMIETIEPLLSLVDSWCVCSLESENLERGSNGSEILQYLQTWREKNCYNFLNVARAMDFVMQQYCKKECDRVIIFGSFYTVAAGKRWIEEQ